jgi:cytochrome c biogenesis protein CcmG/thiol:disulfide interchange protein DsbE
MHAERTRSKAMETSEAFHNGENRQRLPLAWIAAVVIALLVLALLGYAVLADPTEPPEVGSPVPDFQLTALDGSPMNLGDRQGSVVIVNFFASWCAPCRQEAAALEQTWLEYQDRGVQFFGIAYKDADSKAQAFLNEFDVTYPSAVERNNRTARAYGLTGVPETFVVDQQGLLVRHFLGPITQTQLSQEIDRLLDPDSQ